MHRFRRSWPFRVRTIGSTIGSQIGQTVAETSDGAEVCGSDAPDRHAGVAPDVGIASDWLVVERVDEPALPIGERVGRRADLALSRGDDHRGFRRGISGGQGGVDGRERTFGLLDADEREACWPIHRLTVVAMSRATADGSSSGMA
jgi:hypothetical protein